MCCSEPQTLSPAWGEEGEAHREVQVLPDKNFEGLGTETGTFSHKEHQKKQY